MKVETFSLLISILIHLGLLMASFSLSPPQSAKYIKSIKVDYIISLSKINHHLRESSGKSIVSSLTLASGRENRELLKPLSILTKKPSISSNLRFEERILSPPEASNSRKRESLPLFSSFSPLSRGAKSPLMRKTEGRVYLFREENLSQKRLADYAPSLATKPVGLNQTLPPRRREGTSTFVGLSSLKEKKSELTPAPYLPNLLLSRIKRPRVKAGLDLLNLEGKIAKQNKILYQRSDLISVAQPHPLRKMTKPMPFPSIFRGLLEESKMEIERISYTPAYSAESALSRDSAAWISQRKYERKYKTTITSAPLAPIFPPERNLNSFTIKEKKFAPLRSEPDFHREEIRILEEDTELLTEDLQLREYAEKIRKLIKANKKYPSVARQREWEGRIKVRFTINSSGRVIKTDVLSPGSYEVLNRAAEKLIKDTSPFPPLPFSGRKNSLTLEVQVVYQLKEPTLIQEDAN